MKPPVTDIALAMQEEGQRPLETSGRLRLNGAACLPLRFAAYACGLCAEGCPTQAIAVTAEGPAIEGECLGCGQCVAACPSGALLTDGFSLPADLRDGGEEVFVDCWRVSFQDSPAGALRVPCLGGLGKGWLLSLFDRAGEKPIHLLDRGECSFCPAGSGIRTLLATLTEVRTLLFQCGVDIDRLPTMTSLPARKPFSPSIPSTAGELRIDRRGFFRGLMGGVARGTEEIAAAGSAAAAPIILRAQALPIEQMRVAAALTAIAARHGKPVPAQVLPQLSLGDCGAHGVCAKVCPTGALLRQESAEQAELRFHAAQCISCGQCARICPDQAIKLAPSGGASGVEILARWQARTCEQCGNAYFGGGGTRCGSCEKSQQLQQGMAALFGRSQHQ